MQSTFLHRSLIVVTLTLGSLNSFAYDYGDPSAAEQAHLEAINRARANPTTEAKRVGLSSVTEGVASGEIATYSNGKAKPQAPLVFNRNLSTAASAHTQDMLSRDFFAHSSPEGTTPFTRITKTGYQFSNAGENIAFTASTGLLNETVASLQLHDDLFIDEGYAGRGHRINILSSDFREIGIGVKLGKITRNGIQYNAAFVTTDFGSDLTNPNNFLLGVVYDDKNADSIYTAGEGIKGVKISITETGENTTTATAGGYGIPLKNGTYTVTVKHNSLGQVSKSVEIKGQNVKLDILASEFKASADTTPTDNPSNTTPTDNPGNTVTDATGHFDLNTGVLTLPVVNVGGQGYKINFYLALVEPNLVFGLSNNPSDMVAITLPSSGNIPNFDFATSILTVPKVIAPLNDGSTLTFSATMQLLPRSTTDPILFKTLYQLQ
jgi:uncharacterized protein YkwD